MLYACYHEGFYVFLAICVYWRNKTEMSKYDTMIAADVEGNVR